MKAPGPIGQPGPSVTVQTGSTTSEYPSWNTLQARAVFAGSFWSRTGTPNAYCSKNGK